MTRLLYGLLFTIALLKLIVVAGHEVTAIDAPHDDYWQILSAIGHYWCRPYSEWVLMHLPVYPLFVAGVHATGLPLRIAIEVLYLGAAAAVTLSLVRLGLLRWLAPILFALIAFHPHTTYVFDQARAESLTACLILFMVAAFIATVTAPTTGRLVAASAGFSIVTALAWNCRKESVELLSVALATVFAALMLMALVRAFPWRRCMSMSVAVVVAPISAALLLSGVFAIANGLSYGLWSLHQFSAPNFGRALAALVAIKPPFAIPFVVVTREARELAYAESPAFAELRPVLDEQPSIWFKSATQAELRTSGEIGTGWFHWALIWAAAEAGHYKSAAESERYFGQVADEINAALNSGRIPKRKVLLPQIDPAVDMWFPNLGTALASVAGSIVKPVRVADLADQPQLSPAVLEDFNREANRRLPNRARFANLKHRVMDWYPTSMIAFAIVAVASSLISFRRKFWPTPPRTSALLAVVFIASTITLWILLFAFIHASAWNGTQPRYLFPASILVPVLIAAAASVVRCWPSGDKGEASLKG